MSIRIRTVNGMRVALCAAETDPAPGDIYLDDADHYALAAKFMRDWQESGLMEKSVEGWAEWPVMDSQKVRDAKTELEQWQSAHAGKGLTLSVPLEDEDNGRFMAPLEIGKQATPKTVSDTPLYDWNDPRIPEDCEWLATNPGGETRAFQTEPTKHHPYQETLDAWGVLLVTDKPLFGASRGLLELGRYVFDSPGPLVGHIEKRPLKNPLYDWENPCIPKETKWLATNMNGETRAFVAEPKNLNALYHECNYHVLHIVDGQGFEDVGIPVSLVGPVGKKEKRPLPKPKLISVGDMVWDEVDGSDVIAEFLAQTGVPMSFYNWLNPLLPEGCQWLATNDEGWTKVFDFEPKKTRFTKRGVDWGVFCDGGSVDIGRNVFTEDMLLAGICEKRPSNPPSYYWDHPYVQHWLRKNQEKFCSAVNGGIEDDKRTN